MECLPGHRGETIFDKLFVFVEGRTFEDTVAAVPFVAEQGVSLVPESMQQLNLKGIVFRKIRGASHKVNLSIALQRTRPAQLAVNFVSLAQAVGGHS